MLIKSRVVLTSVLALLAVSACTSKDAEKPVAGVSAPKGSTAAIAATVNGTVISQKLVEMILKQQAQQGMPDNTESRKMIIDSLATQLILSQEAAKKGLDKTSDIADQLEMTRQSILAEAYVQDYMKSNTITDDMLTAEYDKIKAQASGSQYKARHILVEKEADAKDKGGDLGWFDSRSMVPEFGAAVTTLEKDKFTEEPVKSKFGYHVILLEDTRPNPIPTLDQVKPGLTQQVQQQNFVKMVEDMKAKATIEITAAPVVTPVAPSAAPFSAPVEAGTTPASAAPDKK